MGKAPDQLEREIDLLRRDTERVAIALERRAKRLADVKAQTEEHPMLLAVMGLSLLMLIGLIAWVTMPMYRQWHAGEQDWGD